MLILKLIYLAIHVIIRVNYFLIWKQEWERVGQQYFSCTRISTGYIELIRSYVTHPLIDSFIHSRQQCVVEGERERELKDDLRVSDLGSWAKSGVFAKIGKTARGEVLTSPGLWAHMWNGNYLWVLPILSMGSYLNLSVSLHWHSAST